jgi:signal transduction histidine kinase/CheY-like chemotaxis protein/HPt (histidine-containing phosphotransfer) domain-containing protein
MIEPDSESDKNPTIDVSVPRRAGRLIDAILIVVAVVSMGVLVGWFIDSPILKRIHPDFVAMNPITAVCLFLSAASLALLRACSWRRSGALLAGCVMLVGASKLVEILLGITLDVDHLLFAAALDAEVTPNRIAPNTALNFLLVGGALIWLHGWPHRGVYGPVLVASISVLLSILALTGYLIGLPTLYRLANYIPMAVHTAASFLVLSVAILLASGGLGLFRTHLLWKIFAAQATVAVLTASVIGVMADRRMSGEFLRELQLRLRSQAELLAVIGEGPLREPTRTLQNDRLGVLSLQTGMRLTIFKADGTPFADSVPVLPNEDPRAVPPEIDEARTSGVGIAERADRAADGRMLFVTVPIRIEGRVAGFARTGFSAAAADGPAQQLRGTIITGTGLAVLAALLLAFALARKLTYPLVDMTDWAGGIAEGRPARELAVASRDEIGRLASAFRSMAAELNRRVVELEEARKAAESASESKSSFLANMSHEIRTPLNGILGLIGLLLRGELTATQRRYVELARASAESLASLINNVLDLSKIEAGKLDVDNRPFSLRELVEGVVDFLGRDAIEKGLEVLCDLDPALPDIVIGDPDRIRQVLVNLVGNAAKFTERGEVVVRVCGSAPPGDSGRMDVRFSVADSGIGVPADRLDRLFRTFSQVDSGITRRFGGSGLGLAICARLVGLMGGGIGVESEAGKGSEFWFTLPLEIGQQPEPARRTIDPASVRVLVVDDNPVQQEILAQQLGVWGFEVRSAGSAEAALAELSAAIERGRPFQVAVLDQDMPGTDGVALGRAIKAEPKLEPTALMILLCLSEAPGPEELRSMGFASFMYKPIRQSQLFDALVTAIHGGIHGTRRPAPLSAGAGGPLSILLVEDNEINQVVAAEILASAGYGCDIASNGEEAVRAAQAKDYDLILMDCQMPVMDGFDATRRIRSDEALDPEQPRVPIVALTANAIKGDREKCFQAGMDGYLSKPIDPNVLVRTIASIANRRGVKGATAAGHASAHPEAGDKPFDIGAVSRRCMNRPNVVRRVVEMFRDGSRDHVERIAAAVRDGNGAALADAAHALKGVAGMLSAEAMHRLALALEVAGREGKLDGAAERVAELEEELERCLAFVPRAIEELDGGAGSPI